MVGDLTARRITHLTSSVASLKAQAESVKLDAGMSRATSANALYQGDGDDRGRGLAQAADLRGDCDTVLLLQLQHSLYEGLSLNLLPVDFFFNLVHPA